jgi:hypothetical protein
MRSRRWWWGWWIGQRENKSRKKGGRNVKKNKQINIIRAVNSFFG